MQRIRDYKKEPNWRAAVKIHTDNQNEISIFPRTLLTQRRESTTRKVVSRLVTLVVAYASKGLNDLQLPCVSVLI